MPKKHSKFVKLKQILINPYLYLGQPNEFFKLLDYFDDLMLSAFCMAELMMPLPFWLINN